MISKPLKLQILSSPIPESAFGQYRVNIIPTGLMHAGKPSGLKRAGTATSSYVSHSVEILYLVDHLLSGR